MEDEVCMGCAILEDRPRSLQYNLLNSYTFQHQTCFSWRICKMRGVGICLLNLGRGTPV